MLLGLWFCMFFSLASSGTGRTRLLTNRTREQSTCLDAQVDRRPGAASAALASTGVGRGSERARDGREEGPERPRRDAGPQSHVPMSWGAGAAPPSLESACLDEGVSFRDRPTPRRRTWPGVREDLETLPKGLGLNASSVWFLIFHPKLWEHSTCHEMVVVAEPVTPLRAGHGIKEWCAVPLRRPRP